MADEPQPLLDNAATVWRMDLGSDASIRARDSSIGDQPNRPVMLADTAHLLASYLLDIDLVVSGSATVTLDRSGNPLYRSTADVTGYDATFRLPQREPHSST